MEIYLTDYIEILRPSGDKDQFIHIEGDTLVVEVIGQKVPISRFQYDWMLDGFQSEGYNIHAEYTFIGDGLTVKTTPIEFVKMHLAARSMAGIED